MKKSIKNANGNRFRLSPTVVGTGEQPVNRTLFVGKDNYDILCGMDSATVDLVAMDPPFNKDAPFIGQVSDPELVRRLQSRQAARARRGSKAPERPPALIRFNDVWGWDDEWNREWIERLGTSARFERLRDAIRAAQGGHGNSMAAYVCFMAARCLELRRILKADGTITLHCDHTACHYLRVMMDVIFGAEQFVSQVIWKRTSAHSSSKSFGNLYDVLLIYGSGEVDVDGIRTDLDETYLRKHYRHDDHDGRGPYRHGDLTGAGASQEESGRPWRGRDVTALKRHWAVPANLPDFFEQPDGWGGWGTLARLDELDSQGLVHWPATPGGMPAFKRYLSTNKGMARGNIWLDPPPLSGRHHERTGWPTQKPLKLYERIIKSCTRPGAMVLDPFCGCATTCVAAERTGRQWIGIDIAKNAGVVLDYRLERDANVTTKAGRRVTGRQDAEIVTGNGDGSVSSLDFRLHIRDYAKQRRRAIPRRTDGNGLAEPHLPCIERRIAELVDQGIRKVSPLGKSAHRLRLAELGSRQHAENPDLAHSGHYRCEMCGTEVKKLGELQIDHVIPLQHFRQYARRFTVDVIHGMANLQLLCPGCNSRKGARLLFGKLVHKD